MYGWGTFEAWKQDSKGNLERIAEAIKQGTTSGEVCEDDMPDDIEAYRNERAETMP